MNCEKGKQLLAGWMDNQLTDAGRAEMEEHLAACPECQQQMEANRRLWDSMGEIKAPAPSDKMQVRFDAMLETYKQEQENRRPGIAFYLQQLFAVRPGFTWAYSLVLLVIGVGLGYWVSRGLRHGTGASSGHPTEGVATINPKTSPNKDTPVSTVTLTGVNKPETATASGTTDSGEASEKQQLKALADQVHEMREMVMLALLENPSASERIRGVSYASDIQTINKNVLDALLSTLNNDPNSNVRLMTLDALTRYANVPAVRRGLVQSILQQDSPLMQAAMADVMVRLQEKKAVQPLKELLQQKDLNEMVRAKIQQTLTRLI
jgi:hypothetical protein